MGTFSRPSAWRLRRARARRVVLVLADAAADAAPAAAGPDGGRRQDRARRDAPDAARTRREVLRQRGVRRRTRERLRAGRSFIHAHRRTAEFSWRRARRSAGL